MRGLTAREKFAREFGNRAAFPDSAPTEALRAKWDRLECDEFRLCLDPSGVEVTRCAGDHTYTSAIEEAYARHRAKLQAEIVRMQVRRSIAAAFEKQCTDDPAFLRAYIARISRPSPNRK